MEVSFNQISESLIKTMFSLVPFGGQALNEVFYDLRGRIKQERLNDFSALLVEYFDKHGPFEYKSLNAVEFSDLFESVIYRVAHNGSIEKQHRFRDILVGYLENPDRDLDHSGTFLELISTLNEPSIGILKYYALYDHDWRQNEADSLIVGDQITKATNELDREKKLRDQGYANSTDAAANKVRELYQQMEQVEDEKQRLSIYTGAEFYHLSADNFLYLKQILISKALLTDHAVGSIGYQPFLDMRITVFGKQFITYIKETII